MRWIARLLTALTLSAMAVAALTWAGWPRPRAVATIEADSEVAFAYQRHWPASPHRLIQQSGGATAFWLLDPDGTLHGPWRPGMYPGGGLVPLGFNTSGRLVAATTDGESWRGFHSGDGYTLLTYDLVGGQPRSIVSVTVRAPDSVRVSRDLSTLAFADGDPVVFDIYDIADGRHRARLTFPDRPGGLDFRDRQVAAFNWELSPDGREVILAEAWDGVRRRTPAGFEVYEIATGRLVRRLPYRDASPPKPSSADVGVAFMGLTSDGSGIEFSRASRPKPVAPADWEPVDLKEPRFACDLANGTPRPSENPWSRPTTRVTRAVGSHGGDALWLRTEPVEYRVARKGVSDADWHRLPGEFGDKSWVGVEAQPGRPAVVYSTGESWSHPNRWVEWLGRRVGKDESNEYLYHDWSGGEFRRFHGIADGFQTSAVGPRDLAVLTRTPTGGTLALWDLPPRGRPWPWSVPAGVALGVLLTAAGVGVRRRAGSVSSRSLRALPDSGR